MRCGLGGRPATRQPSTAPAPPVENPADWFDDERAALAASIRQAADLDLADLAWNLAATAQALTEQFVEVLIAPAYEDGTLETLGAKPDVRLLEDQERRIPLLGEKDIRQAFAVGPDPRIHLDAIHRYAEAGFDHIVFMNAGPDPEGFFEFCQSELLPSVR